MSTELDLSNSDPTLDLSKSDLITYSLTELRELNNDKYCKINKDLDAFFRRISKNKFLHNYLNPHNKFLCPPEQRKKLFPKASAFSDQKLVEDLKAIMTKITDSNVEKMTEKITRFPFTDTSWDLILPMIYNVIIDCVFYVKPLLEVVITLNTVNDKFLEVFREYVLREFQNPRQFTSGGLNLEDPEDKEKRWIISNCQIITNLYLSGYYTDQWLSENFLTPILDNLSPEKTIGIDILNQVWLPIKKKLDIDYQTPIINKMESISTSKDYQARLRFLLMDLLEI